MKSSDGKEEIRSIALTLEHKGTENPKWQWYEYEMTVNGKEFSSGTSPSWHGCWDMAEESIHDAVWGDGLNGPGWLK